MSRKVKCIAVGPAAGKIINSLITSGVENTEFILIDTDPQALEQSLAKEKIFINPQFKKYPVDTSYFRRPSKEEMAELRKQDEIRFEEQNNIVLETVIASKEKIKNAFAGAELLIIVCAMGTAKGLVIMPEMAKIAKEMGIPVSVVLSKPFRLNGNMQADYCQRGIEKLKQYTDAIQIYNLEELTYKEENFKKSSQYLYGIANDDMAKKVKRMAISAQSC